MPKEVEVHTYLRFTAGGSDKDYQIHLVRATDLIRDTVGWLVNFAFGRHGSALKPGTKTDKAVSYEEATKVYLALLKEKQAKGYTTSDTGVAFAATDKEEQVSGLLPQLLNFIPEEALDKYFKDDNYWMEEKKDGRRKMVEKTGCVVNAINRKGLYVGMNDEVLKALMAANYVDFTIDTEDMGSYLYAFDLLSLDGIDFRGQGYGIRHDQLFSLGEDLPEIIQMARAYKNYKEKVDHFAELRSKGAEGVVFKNVDALYTVGRPNSWKNAPQVKFKFYASCVARVWKRNPTKRSVEVAVSDSMDFAHPSFKSVGNVTIPPNYEIPNSGDFVQIRYLHCFPNGGSLYQPIFQGIRDDISDPDTYDSLKFKQVVDGAEEDDET